MLTDYKNMPSSEFLEYIKIHRELADEAIYWFIHEKIAPLLRYRYELFGCCINDEYEDVENDFFLYLRNGKNGCDQVPFKMIESIKQKASFKGWLLSTFRNYLTSRLAHEGTSYVLTTLTDADTEEDNSSDDNLSDEQKIQLSSKLIAYTHQTLLPRDRYILLRTILSILDRRRSLPDEEIATALDLTYINYRVIVHRIKGIMNKSFQLLLNGEELPLDQDHLAMVARIDSDFDNLYPTILAYYNKCVNTLKQSNRIQAIRHQRYEATGFMFHDSDAYKLLIPNAFWKALKMMLIVA